ncbi:MAG: hypothetical protein AB8G99_27410 [Planctomycetaceae bacterium]
MQNKARFGLSPSNLATSLTLRWALVASSVLMVGGLGDSGRKRVKDGVTLFKKREFNDAARAFADAERLLPDDFRVKFNRGCAESRIQNREDAIRLWSLASTSSDRDVAMAAHYNLGNIDVLKAINEFGPSPDTLGKKEREQGFETLARAVRHYRECLAIDPNNIDARRNIEIIRLWQANMRKIWRNVERAQKEREEQKVSLPQLLIKVDAAQFDAFRVNADLLNKQPEASARKELQQKAFELMGELPKKIDQQLEPKTDLAEEERLAIQEARELINGIYSEAKNAAAAALDSLETEKPDESISQQVAALDGVNRMYDVVAMFPELVQRAVQLQEAVVASTELPIEPRAEDFTADRGNLLLDRENRVSGLSAILTLKAEQFKDIIAQQTALREKHEGPAMKSQIEQDMDRYRIAVKRAIELNEELNEELKLSSGKLRLLQLADASPHAARALEILKEIAETLPKPKQNDQGKGENQQQQQEENEDQKGDQNEPKDEPNDDSTLTDADPPEEDEEQQEQKTEQQEQELRDREEVEALLRKVRDREQALKDRKAILRAIRARQSKVKRDW